MFKVFDFFIELAGWLKIVGSPFFGGAIIGTIIYLNREDTIGLVIGIAIALCGLIGGMVWATRIWKKQGTNRFLSKIMQTPELDEENNK